MAAISLIFLGRIHPDKGVHLAIEVARLSGLPLLIAGIIQDRTYFREQVEPHLDETIRYIGPVDVAGKNELFAARPCAAASEHHPGTIRTGPGGSQCRRCARRSPWTWAPAARSLKTAKRVSWSTMSTKPRGPWNVFPKSIAARAGGGSRSASPSKPWWRRTSAFTGRFSIWKHLERNDTIMKPDIVRRYAHNPILTKADIPYPVETVHNAAVVKHASEYVMLFRSHLRTGRSIIGLARSPDGFRFTADPQPFLTPARDGPFAAYEEFGVEDPRVTLLDGEYVITYSAYSRNGVRIALAKTKDFSQVERVSLITEADYRNVVIFPEKFDGLYARLDRPHSEIAPWSIWISYSPDLRFWGESQLIMRPEPYHWDEMKIGPGAPPIKTDRGWLSIYHGVFRRWTDRSTAWASRCTICANPAKIVGSGRLVDSSAGRSLGSHRICPQRGVHLWRRCGARWNREDLLGRRGHGDVRGRGQHLRSGRVMPGARQTGEMSG